MALTYSTSLKTARMNAIVTAIGNTGVLEIGTTGMAQILATIPLAATAGTVTGTNPVKLTFTPGGMTDSSADATGTAAAARIRTAPTGSGSDVITGLTVGTSSADIILDNVSINAGQQVTISSAFIDHAA
jgi:hypothetical protein